MAIIHASFDIDALVTVLIGGWHEEKGQEPISLKREDGRYWLEPGKYEFWKGFPPNKYKEWAADFKKLTDLKASEAVLVVESNDFRFEVRAVDHGIAKTTDSR